MAVSPISGLHFMAPPCSEYHIRDIGIGRPPHGGKWGNSLAMVAIHPPPVTHPSIHRSMWACPIGPKITKQAGSGGLFCSSHSPLRLRVRAHAHLMIKARGGGGGGSALFFPSAAPTLSSSNSIVRFFRLVTLPPSASIPSVHSFSKCIDSAERESRVGRQSGAPPRHPSARSRVRQCGLLDVPHPCGCRYGHNEVTAKNEEGKGDIPESTRIVTESDGQSG